MPPDKLLIGEVGPVDMDPRHRLEGVRVIHAAAPPSPPNGLAEGQHAGRAKHLGENGLAFR
jgi:hypothetical protein